ncbi:MAG: glycosyltransferase family 2 protein [Deltaproteobacteria bacterium]|nr:glycosyltransferase family 2 protein [Deltaproteobacteria bacterium]
MNESPASNSIVISVVAPLYNEQDSVPVFVERLTQVFNRIGCQWEVVFALDPSTDQTRRIVLERIDRGYPIRLVTFSRRIGKPVSVLAGLHHTMGDACVVMDVDLQDPPELIEEMVEKWREGYKVVIAQRVSRKGEHYLYLKAAELYYWILDRLSEVKVPKNTGDYRLLDARVVREICRFRERHAFLRGITAAVGFPTIVIPFDRDPRFAGKTRISFFGALNIALDGLVPFSRTPVRLIFLLGIVLLGLASAGAMIWIVASLVLGLSDQWPSILACLVSLILSGLTTTCLGVIGEYVLRIYEETRDRPLYIVDEINESQTVPRKLCQSGQPREPAVHGSRQNSSG